MFCYYLLYSQQSYVKHNVKPDADILQTLQGLKYICTKAAISEACQI
jgi:hypothetical protein